MCVLYESKLSTTMLIKVYGQDWDGVWGKNDPAKDSWHLSIFITTMFFICFHIDNKIANFSIKQTLVENIAKKNRSRFFIAVLLTAHVCNRLNNYIFFWFTKKNLRIWGLLIYQWKGLENTFSNGVLHAQKN